VFAERIQIAMQDVHGLVRILVTDRRPVVEVVRGVVVDLVEDDAGRGRRGSGGQANTAARVRRSIETLPTTNRWG